MSMSMDTVKCEQCGAEIPRSTRFCPECGHSNPAAATTAAVSGDAPSSGFLTPEMSMGGIPAQQPETTGDTGPTGGSPTVNIGNTTPASESQSAQSTQPSQPLSQGQGQPTQYIAPSQQSYTPPPAAQYTPPPATQYAPPPNYAQTQNFNQGTGAQPPAQTYGGYSQNPITYPGQYQQVGVAGAATKDSTIALLLELIGYFGFLGIGHIYAGRTGRGIALMVGWWIYLAMATFLTIFVIGLCFFAIGIAVPILSGVWIKMELDKGTQLFGGRF